VDAQAAGSLHIAVQGQIGICVTRERLVGCRHQILCLKEGPAIADIFDAEQLGFDAHPPLKRDIGPQPLEILLAGQDQETRLDEAALAAHKLLEIVEDLQAVIGHAGGDFIRVVLANDG